MRDSTHPFDAPLSGTESGFEPDDSEEGVRVMRTTVRALLGGAIMMFFAFGWAFAPGGSQGDGIHSWPDSLVSIEVTGTILVNTTFAHPLYYLDEGDDGDAEYHLSFGPWWYEPESGLTRPVAGEVVTIAGVVQEGDGALITILVCEVDGELWRLQCLPQQRRGQDLRSQMIVKSNQANLKDIIDASI